MTKKTALYWSALLRPDVELFVDTDPTQPALDRLLDEIRRGKVSRIVVRSLSDFCFTLKEFWPFLDDIIKHQVHVEQIWDALPLESPELRGRYRHRQMMAKVIRLRRRGLTISETCSLVHCSPKQVSRILSRQR